MNRKDQLIRNDSGNPTGGRPSDGSTSGSDSDVMNRDAKAQSIPIEGIRARLRWANSLTGYKTVQIKGSDIATKLQINDFHAGVYLFPENGAFVEFLDRVIP